MFALLCTPKMVLPRERKSLHLAMTQNINLTMTHSTEIHNEGGKKSQSTLQQRQNVTACILKEEPNAQKLKRNLQHATAPGTQTRLSIQFHHHSFICVLLKQHGFTLKISVLLTFRTCILQKLQTPKKPTTAHHTLGLVSCDQSACLPLCHAAAFLARLPVAAFLTTQSSLTCPVLPPQTCPGPESRGNP